ncbi:MAG: hypothetical protein Phog2KO_26560 [Phototrophicaceae bacterium]
MLEIIVAVIGVILVILFIIGMLWRLTFGGMLRSALFTFFGLLHKTDKDVDPEATIYPNQEPRISDVMQEQADLHKGGVVSSPVGHEAIPQASIPATTNHNNQTKYQPPYTENPVTIAGDNSATVQAVTPTIEGVVSAPQPLVEDNTFNRNDPIIDSRYIDPETPSADTLDAHTPKSDSSPFGVRSASHSPGRRLRDKRSSRNSS